jgi:hypothetical protein
MVPHQPFIPFTLCPFVLKAFNVCGKQFQDTLCGTRNPHPTAALKMP